MQMPSYEIKLRYTANIYTHKRYMLTYIKIYTRRYKKIHTHTSNYLPIVKLLVALS